MPIFSTPYPALDRLLSDDRRSPQATSDDAAVSKLCVLRCPPPRCMGASAGVSVLRALLPSGWPTSVFERPGIMEWAVGKVRYPRSEIFHAAWFRQILRQPRILRRSLRPLLRTRPDAPRATHQSRSAPD